MSTAEPRNVLRPSVLQRLLRQTEVVQRPGWQADLGVDELRAEVRENLERILNARTREPAAELKSHPQVARSLMTYGLPDLSQFTRASAVDVRVLQRIIKDAVTIFEPRLDPGSVRVHICDADEDDVAAARRGTHLASVHFRISATLDVEPIREDVEFDNEVDFTTGSVSVREAT